MKILQTGVRLALPAIVVAVAALSASTVLGRAGHTGAATKYTAYVGGGRASISVETFRPNVIFVNTGDTVEFTNPYEEIHTVTFTAGKPAPDFVVPLPGSGQAGPPTLIVNPQVGFPAPPSGPASYDGTQYVNSGVLMKGQTFSVTFPKDGNYPFLCVLHPGMTGFVQVLHGGVTVPTQAQRDAEAQTQLDQAVAQGEAAAASVQTSRTTNPNGTSTVNAVTGPAVGQVDVMRFIPGRLQLNVGDTVNWTNNTPVPHTVTFTSGAAIPEAIMPQPQPAGPPNLVLNPQVLFPAKPSQNYEGTGFVNSGFIGTGPEATAGTTFSLTFTRPGTYSYVCVLHADQGMTGVVVVGAGVTPPSTGDGGVSPEGRPQRSYLGLSLGGAALLLAFGFMARTRLAR